ncbi:hypothetical protein [Tabrizicola sp.]|uniref:hypothetical protein n=1 Tax=Tabrizicola sp. TaxID=2005166 RepID=UPI002734F213|nr:hypothetical protein [Tabrizicola sp.]MDP3194009.1 hypothetical protein [Tabrizicola sp.]
MALIEDLLDQAAEALLAGNLAELAALGPRLESASVPQDRATLQRLQAKAQRNARLLEAATRGVKAARLRVAEITRGPTLTTYDARGQKAQIAPQGLIPARRV